MIRRFSPPEYGNQPNVISLFLLVDDIDAPALATCSPVERLAIGRSVVVPNGSFRPGALFRLGPNLRLNLDRLVHLACTDVPSEAIRIGIRDHATNPNAVTQGKTDLNTSLRSKIPGGQFGLREFSFEFLTAVIEGFGVLREPFSFARPVLVLVTMCPSWSSGILICDSNSKKIPRCPELWVTSVCFVVNALAWRRYGPK